MYAIDRTCGILYSFHGDTIACENKSWLANAKIDPDLEDELRNLPRSPLPLSVIVSGIKTRDTSSMSAEIAATFGSRAPKILKRLPTGQELTEYDRIYILVDQFDPAYQLSLMY